MSEEWREVPGRPGYLVSDQGRSAKLMTLRPSGKLPYIVRHVPRPSGGRYRDYLHHWVLLAFKGPKPFKGAVARHLNDQPLDNRAENLEWGTRTENIADQFRNGIKTLKAQCMHGHLLSGPNLTKDGHCRECSRERARQSYRVKTGA